MFLYTSRYTLHRKPLKLFLVEPTNENFIIVQKYYSADQIKEVLSGRDFRKQWKFSHTNWRKNTT
jgi:hypothetical protein